MSTYATTASHFVALPSQSAAPAALPMATPFPKSNYLHPVRREALMPGVAIPLIILSTFTISVRMWSRITRQTGSFGLDDVLIFLSYVFAMALSIGAIDATRHFGYDRHIWDVQPRLLVPSALRGWIGEVIFLITTCLCKIGILLFYRRIVEGSRNKRLLYACWAGIAFTIVYGIVFITILCTTCKPVNAFWNRYDANYLVPHVCDAPNSGPAVSGAMSVLSDLYAVVLPFLVVRKLQIPKKQIFGLYAVFAFGMIVVSCGIARTVFLNRLAFQTQDTTWTSLDIFIASNLEAQLSIIGACLPNLRRLFAGFFGDSGTRYYSSRRFPSPFFRSSKDLTSFHGQPNLMTKRERDILIIEDIELASTTGSGFTAYDQSPIQGPRDQHFNNAYLYEKELPSPPRPTASNASKRMRIFPHTVF